MFFSCNSTLTNNWRKGFVIIKPLSSTIEIIGLASNQARLGVKLKPNRPCAKVILNTESYGFWVIGHWLKKLNSYLFRQ